MVLSGEAEGPGNIPPGDIIVEIKEVKHPLFVRRWG